MNKTELQSKKITLLGKVIVSTNSKILQDWLTIRSFLLVKHSKIINGSI